MSWQGYLSDSASSELFFHLGLDFWISVFVSALSNFSKNPLGQFNQDLSSSVSDHPLYLIGFLTLQNPLGDFWSPWPAFSKDSVRLV